MPVSEPEPSAAALHCVESRLSFSASCVRSHVNGSETGKAAED